MAALGQWKIVPIGKGFYEFAFSSVEDLKRVLSVGSWMINPGTLRLFSWAPDFKPNLVKQTIIKILALPQEYWRPKILFTIARGIGIPFSLDDATSNRTFGHYARILVDIDLSKPIRDQILVEREDLALWVEIEYEHLPSFCTSCSTIGHVKEECFKLRKANDSNKEFGPYLVSKKTVAKYVPKELVKEVVLKPALDKGKEIIVDNTPASKEGEVNKVMVQVCKGKTIIIDHPSGSEGDSSNKVQQEDNPDADRILSPEVRDTCGRAKNSNLFLPDNVSYVWSILVIQGLGWRQH